MNITIENLYLKHKNELVYHVFQILHCHDLAEEIVQESFIKFSVGVKKQLIENPRSYLFRIAKNLAFDYLKHQKVTDNYAQSQDVTIMPEIELPSLEQEAADQQKLAILRGVIDELPPRCRQVFALHNIHGMSYSEIAKDLGISESGVEKHIMKGLQHCRKRMKNLLPA
jgi:RNA polymerase sigma-70 factor (ECF subfamily)